jgi:hypothetical protein
MQGEQPKQDVGSGSPNQLAGLKAKLDEMSKLVSQVQAARSSGARVRVGIAVVLLAVVLGFVWHMYDYVANQYPVSELQAKMQARLLNADAGAMKEFITMMQGVWPVYQDEIRREFQQSWPDIKAKVESEAKQLMEMLPAAAEERGRARLDAIAKRQEARMLEAFPELQDEQTREIIMTNLQKALEGAVLNVFEKRLTDAQEKLADVQAKVLEFIPEGEREQFVTRMESIWEQLLLYELGGRELIKE